MFEPLLLIFDTTVAGYYQLPLSKNIVHSSFVFVWSIENQLHYQICQPPDWRKRNIIKVRDFRLKIND
jgi:hypothetical protein